jgi:hypothetical protein
MKKLTTFLLLIPFASFAQNADIQTTIETLLKGKVENTKVTIIKTDKILEIKQHYIGANYDLKIPCALVSCTFDNQVKNVKNSVYQVNAKCLNNDDCIINSKNSKANHTNSIWLSFSSKEDANTFISLMDQLKNQK